MANNLLVGAHGAKSFVSIGDLDSWMDREIEQRISGRGNVDKYFSEVSWLYRGVMLRAQAIASMPFQVLRGQEVIDQSDDYQNVLEFLPDPTTLWLLVEMSLTLTGTAYLAPAANRYATARGTLSEMLYYAPHTIKPMYDPVSGALTHYERKVNSRTVELPVNKVYNFWYPDYSVELGVPMRYPAKAACMASGVLYNLDAFVEAFFKSGAIKSTIIALAGNPPKTERDRFGEIWEKTMQGFRNMFGKLVVSADSVTATVVGEGVKDLGNQELNAAQRESIAAAMTIPYTILFSGSASGLGGGEVTAADDKRFAFEFQIPEATWIFRRFTEQVLKPIDKNLRLVPNLEALDVTQEDEVARMNAVSTLTDVINKCSSWEQFLAVAKVNGMEWDGETDKLLQQVFKVKEERRLEQQEMMQAQGQPTDDNGKPARSNFPISKPKPKELGDGKAVSDGLGSIMVTGGDSVIADSVAPTPTDGKAVERTQFKRWASKRDASKWGEFKFQHLDETEQAALKAEQGGAANGDMSAEFFRKRDEIRRRGDAAVLCAAT